jgi:hypothetical protein
MMFKEIIPVYCESLTKHMNEYTVWTRVFDLKLIEQSINSVKAVKGWVSLKKGDSTCVYFGSQTAAHDWDKDVCFALVNWVFSYVDTRLILHISTIRTDLKWEHSQESGNLAKLQGSKSVQLYVLAILHEQNLLIGLLIFAVQPP